MPQEKNYIYAFIFLLAVGFMGWLYVQKQNDDQNIKAPSKNQPDSRLFQVKVRQFNQFGTLANQLQAKEIIHFKQNNRADITQPVYQVFSQKQAPWKITADFAQSLKGNQEIDLRKNVIIHQNASHNKAWTTVLTEQLNYYPHKKYVHSNVLVTMKQPGITVNSVGMNAYLKTERVQLLSQTQAIYTPNKTKKHLLS